MSCSVQILHLFIAKRSALKIPYALPLWHAAKPVLEGALFNCLEALLVSDGAKRLVE